MAVQFQKRGTSTPQSAAMPARANNLQTNNAEELIRAQTAPQQPNGAIQMPSTAITKPVKWDPADAGAGSQGMSETDLLLLETRLTQAGGPELDPTSDKYNARAKKGWFLDQTTGEVNENLDVVICRMETVFVEKTPKKLGGEFVKNHGGRCPDGVDKINFPWQLENGNEVHQEFMFLVLVIDPSGEFKQTIFRLRSTATKPARGVWTKIYFERVNGQRSPSYHRVWHVRSFLDHDDKHSWYNWVFVAGEPTLTLPNGGELYGEARRLSGVSEPPSDSITDNDVPF
jgi:hypothetical protein